MSIISKIMSNKSSKVKEVSKDNKKEKQSKKGNKQAKNEKPIVTPKTEVKPSENKPSEEIVSKLPYDVNSSKFRQRKIIVR